MIEFLIILLFLFGYVQNLLKVWLMYWYGLTFSTIQTELSLRLFGAVVLPIGIVGGFINMPTPIYQHIPSYILHFGRRCNGFNSRK
jgi:hypothetical protein